MLQNEAKAAGIDRPFEANTGSAQFQVDRTGVVIEAIKRAEKENAVIVRLYEAHGTRGVLNLKISLPVSGACLADLMERSLDKVEVQGGNITLPIEPFEIITLKLYFSPA